MRHERRDRAIGGCHSATGILLLAIIAVESGGTFIIRVVRGSEPMTPFQKVVAAPPTPTRASRGEENASVSRDVAVGRSGGDVAGAATPTTVQDAAMVRTSPYAWPRGNARVFVTHVGAVRW